MIIYENSDMTEAEKLAARNNNAGFLLDYAHPIGSIFTWNADGVTEIDLSTVAKVEAYFGGEWETYGSEVVPVYQYRRIG